MTERPIAIIGSGPAGYTAAIYAARAGLSPLVITGEPTDEDPERLVGGQLASTTDVENYPGFPEPMNGMDLMDRLEAQARRSGAELVYENVVGVDLRARPFLVTTPSQRLTVTSLIVATGARTRWLGVPGEQEYRGRGVAACAICEGAVFRGREVIVIGGGDSALHDALYLSRVAHRVRLVHRRQTLSASPTLVEQLRRERNIELELGAVVEEVLGDGAEFSRVRLRTNGGGTRELRADGLFVAIGRTPATAFLDGQLALDPRGYIVTEGRGTATSVAGVFAAGDVQDPRYRQAVVAAGSGAMAALDAERWLSEQSIKAQDHQAA